MNKIRNVKRYTDRGAMRALLRGKVMQAIGPDGRLGAIERLRDDGMLELRFMDHKGKLNAEWVKTTRTGFIERKVTDG